MNDLEVQFTDFFFFCLMFKFLVKILEQSTIQVNYPVLQQLLFL